LIACRAYLALLHRCLVKHNCASRRYLKPPDRQCILVIVLPAPDPSHKHTIQNDGAWRREKHDTLTISSSLVSSEAGIDPGKRQRRACGSQRCLPVHVQRLVCDWDAPKRWHQLRDRLRRCSLPRETLPSHSIRIFRLKSRAKFGCGVCRTERDSSR
jgi:hypothetical protein